MIKLIMDVIHEHTLKNPVEYSNPKIIFQENILACWPTLRFIVVLKTNQIFLTAFKAIIFYYLIYVGACHFLFDIQISTTIARKKNQSNFSEWAMIFPEANAEYNNTSSIIWFLCCWIVNNQYWADDCRIIGWVSRWFGREKYVFWLIYSLK